MNSRLLRAICFVVVLSIYVTLLAILARALPLLFLTGLLAWLVVRRPFVYPERIEPDVRLFSEKAGQTIGRLIGVLARTWTGGP